MIASPARGALAAARRACARATPLLLRVRAGHWLAAGALVLAACGGGNQDATAAEDAQSGAVAVDAATATASTPSAVVAGTGERATALAAETWMTCASENGTCSVPGTVTVRYGANGVYAYRTVTGSIGCNNGVWGDPLPGVVKACAYSTSTGTTSTTTSATGTWTPCADEWATCSFSGTRNVRYGANGIYITKSATGSIACTNAAFGNDPVVGVVKSCAYDGGSTGTTSGSTSGSTTTTGWTRCASEWGTCSVSGTRDVRYGANGVYVTRTVTGSIACTNTAFGGDPLVGVVKACDAAAGGTTTGTTTGGTTTTTPTTTTVSGPAPRDVSSPTTVVGSGSAASCTETALRNAVAAGGVVTFNCGSTTTTIALTQPLVAPTDKDTTIDGANRIVLDGQGATQILRSYHGDFRVNDRVLAVQRLVMRNGRDVGTNYVPRNGTLTCAWGYKDGGGGAIYTRDVNVFVWGVTFEGNRGPDIGPDVAGGAIYVMGAKKLTVNNSVFRNNTASNGGGIGVLHVASELHNTVFENNRAIGQLANFAGATGCPVFNHAEQGGAGGLGGAFYSDGFSTDDVFFKVRFTANSANHLGGALFRSAYWGIGWGKQSITWDDSVFERNTTPLGGGGAAYVNNSFFTVRNTRFDANDAGSADGGALKVTGATVQFSDLTVTNNRAAVGGGIAQWSGGPEGVGTSARITFSGNVPSDSAGVFPR